MNIKPTTTVTRKGRDKNHYGYADLRIHQTGQRISWKRGELGSAVTTINSGKPADAERWIEISCGEHTPKHSKETHVTFHGDAARQIYEYLRDVFESDK